MNVHATLLPQTYFSSTKQKAKTKTAIFDTRPLTYCKQHTYHDVVAIIALLKCIDKKKLMQKETALCPAVSCMILFIE